MFKRRFRLPSPALVISMITLSLVLGGTAFAASTATHKDKKADIKLIKKLAPTLSVKHARTAASATTAGHATSADSATNATNATNATHATSATNANHASTADSAANGNLGYAHIKGDATVDSAHSTSNITTANVVYSGGFWCFKGLPFTPHSAQLTLDYNGILNGQIPQITLILPASPSDCGLTSAQAEVFTGLVNPGVFTSGAELPFYILFQ
jgi:hypothetical protein